MSDTMDNDIEEVTVKAEKPKDPKRVAWGKKLGEKNKGSKKKAVEEEIQESNSTIYFLPVALAAVGIAAYVMYYSKSKETSLKRPTAQEGEIKRSTQKKKLNLDL